MKRNLGYTGMLELNSNVVVEGYDVTINGDINDGLAVEIKKSDLVGGYIYVRLAQHKTFQVIERGI